MKTELMTKPEFVAAKKLWQEHEDVLTCAWNSTGYT